MNAEAVSFILLWIVAMQERCNMTWEQAFGSVIHQANAVILAHNVQYDRVQAGKLYWLDTSNYSDNKCVFSAFLERNKTYSVLSYPYTGEFNAIFPERGIKLA